MERKHKAVPEEIQIEIMLRMPLKSLLKCICVSTRWASIIRGKHFKDLYLLRSMTRPRLLFAFGRRVLDPTPGLLFHSVYQEETPLLSSGQQQMRVLKEAGYAISATIRGLVCLRDQSSAKVVLCNPGTRKFLALPKFGGPEAYFLRSFLGYDEATDVFKVLCRTTTQCGKSADALQHQIFTVRSGEESWRPIVCNTHHTPLTNGICEGGVLYYGAWTGPENKSMVMSFNVRSEEFNVIELPEGVKVNINATLVNYNGEVALVNYSVDENEVLQFWVRNETTGEWPLVRFVIPCWRETVGDMMFGFEGTIGTGELVFTLFWLHEGSHIVLYYDTVTKNLRKFKIEQVVGDQFHFAKTFLNHVDSLFLT